MANSQFLPSAALFQGKCLQCPQNRSHIGLQNLSGGGETSTLFLLYGIERKPFDFMVYSPTRLSQLLQTVVATLCHLVTRIIIKVYKYFCNSNINKETVLSNVRT